MSDRGDSGSQRGAEGVIRALASEHYDKTLESRAVVTPHGGEIRLDGVANDDSMLMEIYAHQGPLKGSQPRKVMSDAFKLTWARYFVSPSARMVIALSCHEAARTLKWDDEAAKDGRRQPSWMAEALHDLGVEVEVFELPDGGEEVRGAQVRQFR